jgi:hypothetical protein
MDLSENDVRADTGYSPLDAWVNQYVTLNLLFAVLLLSLIYTVTDQSGANPVLFFTGAVLAGLVSGTALKWGVRRARSG